MATRFRIEPWAGVELSSLAAHSYWDINGGMVRLKMFDDGDDRGSQTSKTITETSSSRQSTVMIQAHSRRLVAQNISGTLKGQFQTMEPAVGADSYSQIHVRVVDGTGALRGVLYASDKTLTVVSAVPGDPNYEWNTVKENRKMPPGWTGAGVSLTPLDVYDGDFLIVELGVRYVNTVTTSYVNTLYYAGYTSGGDLPENETDTGAKRGWLEFSDDIVMGTPTVVQDWQASRLIPRGVGTNKVWRPRAIKGQIWPRGSGRQ